ncbi:hypothetical protein GGS23DRAFT_579642 [Durotheca rogersii]|uniref:uncharacterized protein n=1 Tax=Durotheca rogersii TaxID=419775 RepID=UPI00221E6C0D|nr:uncharacterized protein GGS23DRAFT_579642 [Durotheca rogersii]KAI5860646.1 hypothetical protein GGS23DRAFT_579642 [Durotheca rogersii]
MIREATQTEGGIFRAADGSLEDGERILRIWLKDFGNPHDCPGIDSVSGKITISLSQLYDMVQRAEARAQTTRQVIDDVGPPGIVSRKRDRSPPEKLRASDEKRFKAADEEVDEQFYNQDDEYVPRGGLAGCHTEQETGAIRRGPPRKAKTTEGPVTSREAS